MEKNTGSKLISQTFFWMFLGLLGTAIVSWYTYSSGLFIEIVMNNMWRTLLIAEVIVVILFSLLFKKLSPTLVGILYFVYAALNGVTLSSIFYCFELNSIIYLFLASALLFGGLAFYGYKTERDVSSWHNILFAVLIVGIILSIINIKSTLIVGIVFLLLAIELLFSYFKEESVTNVDTFFKIITFSNLESNDS